MVGRDRDKGEIIPAIVYTVYIQLWWVEMSLVTGIRVKCNSYKNTEKREKMVKQKEEELDK